MRLLQDLELDKGEGGEYYQAGPGKTAGKRTGAGEE